MQKQKGTGAKMQMRKGKYREYESMCEVEFKCTGRPMKVGTDGGCLTMSVKVEIGVAKSQTRIG
jgi:hypothetical protein